MTKTKQPLSPLSRRVALPRRWRRALVLISRGWCRALIALALLGVSASGGQSAQQGSPSAGAWVEFTIGPLHLWSPPELAGQTAELAEDAEEWLPRLHADLGGEPSGLASTQPFAIAVVDRGAWRRTAAAEMPVEERSIRRLDARAPSWAAGYVLPRERVGVIRLDRVNTYPFDGAPNVLVHEVSHQLLHDRVGDRVPRWFDEALATFEGRRRGLRDVAVLLQSSLFADVPPLRGLDYEFLRNEARARRAYAASLEFLDWSIRRYDRRARGVEDSTFVRRLLSALARDSALDFEGAWRQAAGEPLFLAEQEWREGRWRLDRWVPVLFMNPTLFWAGLALLSLLAAFLRRRRSLAQRERWRQEEELEDLVNARPARPLIN